MEEVWRDIKGYEGIYQVSNLGRVKSLDRKIRHSKSKFLNVKGKVLKPKIGTSGYLEVDLRQNGKHQHCRIHRLVAQAFIPNPNNFPIVNHKDENKLNANVNNLEWCNSKYNSNWGTAIERTVNKKSIKIIQIDKDSNKIINVFASSAEAARKTGIGQGHISSCCTGKRKTTGGYRWKYAEDEIYSEQYNKDS